MTLVVLVLAAAIAYLLRRASEHEARIEALTARISALVAERNAAAAPAPPASARAAEPSAATGPPLLPRTAPAPATTAMPSQARVTIAPTATAPAAPLHDRESLERRIGAQWLLYIGVIAIVVGVSYRVSSVIGLGIALLFASFLYQQFRVDSPADHAQ